jgi:hypothetical protein
MSGTVAATAARQVVRCPASLQSLTSLRTHSRQIYHTRVRRLEWKCLGIMHQAMQALQALQARALVLVAPARSANLRHTAVANSLRVHEREAAQSCRRMSVTTDLESLLCRRREATCRKAKLRTGLRDGKTWRMLRTDVEDSSLAMNGESGRVLQEWR